MAEGTEMRIIENNVASPKIMLIQGRQQEATVESAERTRPQTIPGRVPLYNGPVGTWGIPRV